MYSGQVKRVDCLQYYIRLTPMEHSQFTISYYIGEEYERPQLKENHDSIEEAAIWCQRNYVPLSVVEITEWDLEEN